MVGNSMMRVGQSAIEVESVTVLYRSPKVQKIRLNTKTKCWEDICDIGRDFEYPMLWGTPVVDSDELAQPVEIYLPDFKGWSIDVAYPAKYGIEMYLVRGRLEPIKFVSG